MNRHDRRGSIVRARRHIRRANAAHSDDFAEVPREKWPAGANPAPVRVCRSRKFLVMVYDEAGGVKRLSVCRTAIENSGHWKSDITWDDLQAIKAGVGYADADAVEVYPRDDDVVNVANMRHLWVLPEPLAFAWRGGVVRL